MKSTFFATVLATVLALPAVATTVAMIDLSKQVNPTTVGDAKTGIKEAYASCTAMVQEKATGRSFCTAMVQKK